MFERVYVREGFKSSKDSKAPWVLMESLISWPLCTTTQFHNLIDLYTHMPGGMLTCER